MFDTLSKAGKYLGQAAKMMIGVPDYDNYEPMPENVDEIVTQAKGAH